MAQDEPEVLDAFRILQSLPALEDEDILTILMGIIHYLTQRVHTNANDDTSMRSLKRITGRSNWIEVILDHHEVPAWYSRFGRKCARVSFGWRLCPDAAIRR